MDWIRFQFLLFILVLYIISMVSSELGSPCASDRQCKVDNSHCSSGVCQCKHYHAQMNTTKCLESKLLGRECLVSEQCSLRVANSTCVEGHCHCSQGFIRFRKHTCLGPAKPGEVCYNDEHCQLWSQNSHCQFLIPKLFGKCVCDGEGNCKQTEITKVPETYTTVFEINKTEMTTLIPELVNEGESSELAMENNKMASAGFPYSHLFLQQNQNLQESPIHDIFHSEKPENDSVGLPVTTPEETRLENMATEVRELEETTTLKDLELSINTEISMEGSKYRVEANEKEISGTTVNRNKVSAVSLGYACRTDVECQKRDSQSRCLNGVCDCVVKSNKTNSCSRYHTGCGPETFQCRESGVCISWFFVCDGRYDCPDKSDEECQGSKCPKSSFQCKTSGTCVSLGVICDGVKNCPNGEDEHFCIPGDRNFTQGCPQHTFQCANGECLPKFEFCNAIPKCSDGSDESPQLCRSHALSKKATNKRKNNENCPFECGNGRCRSTAIVCSGRDGCGDNSDEVHCAVCSCPRILSGN